MDELNLLPWQDLREVLFSLAEMVRDVVVVIVEEGSLCSSGWVLRINYGVLVWFSIVLELPLLSRLLLLLFV